MFSSSGVRTMGRTHMECGLFDSDRNFLGVLRFFILHAREDFKVNVASHSSEKKPLTTPRPALEAPPADCVANLPKDMVSWSLYDSMVAPLMYSLELSVTRIELV